MFRAIKLYLLAFWALISLTNEEDLVDYLNKIGFNGGKQMKKPFQFSQMLYCPKCGKPDLFHHLSRWTMKMVVLHYCLRADCDYSWEFNGEITEMSDEGKRKVERLSKIG